MIVITRNKVFVWVSTVGFVCFILGFFLGLYVQQNYCKFQMERSMEKSQELATSYHVPESSPDIERLSR